MPDPIGDQYPGRDAEDFVLLPPPKPKVPAIIAAVCIAVVLFFGGVQYYQNAQRAKEGADARRVLCILKQDRIQRLADAKQFLRDNPNGISGIPAATIKVSIHNQEVTLTSMETLKC